ncbi:hypothetical protein Vafri_1859 [Volvox africanus]|nr:hypothetical protein Vafri_1859 [Volvox africanus]
MVKTQLKDPLGAENYSIWKVRFTQLNPAAVHSQRYSRRSEGGALGCIMHGDAKAKENAIKALCIMAENVQDLLLKTVMMAKSAKMAWDALEKRFTRTMQQRKLALMGSYMRLRQGEAEGVQDYVGRALALRVDLLSVTHEIRTLCRILTVWLWQCYSNIH